MLLPEGVVDLTPPPPAAAAAAALAPIDKEDKQNVLTRYNSKKKIVNRMYCMNRMCR